MKVDTHKLSIYSPSRMVLVRLGTALKCFLLLHVPPRFKLAAVKSILLCARTPHVILEPKGLEHK